MRCYSAIWILMRELGLYIHATENRSEVWLHMVVLDGHVIPLLSLFQLFISFVQQCLLRERDT
jgi:pentose-5-phosphate-3-epimerase